MILGFPSEKGNLTAMELTLGIVHSVERRRTIGATTQWCLHPLLVRIETLSCRIQNRKNRSYLGYSFIWCDRKYDYTSAGIVCRLCPMQASNTTQGDGVRAVNAISEMKKGLAPTTLHPLENSHELSPGK